MRQAATIEKLYLDFDGFFASVMQQAMPKLRGRPVGVIPFETSAADSTVVIACSKEAKAAGCKNVMRVPEARQICPDIVLVTQRPDLFRRAHNTLINEISCEIPIETVKSIDELACKLDKAAIADPETLAQRIKERIRTNIGDQITCSIGFAANRLLAKIACKIGKPNGVTLCNLSPANARQLDLFLNDDRQRQRCEALTNTIDRLNRKFGKRVLTLGPWMPPPGGYAGGKIAYNRIPSAEDFW